MRKRTTPLFVAAALIAATQAWAGTPEKPLIEIPSSPIECYIQLLPPQAIHRYGLDFVSRALLDLSNKPSLEKAAKLTQYLFDLAREGQLEIKMKEMEPAFEAAVKFTFNGDSIEPVITGLSISHETAKALFELDKNVAPGAVIVASGLPRELMSNWLVALAEISAELDFKLGLTSIDNVNLWTVFDTKTKWLKDYAMAHGDLKTGAMLPTQAQAAAEMIWPAMAKAVAERDYRTVMLSFGLGRYEWVSSDAKNLARALNERDDAHAKAVDKLNRQMSMNEGRYRGPFYELGARAAHLLTAEAFVEYPFMVKVAEISERQAQALLVRAQRQFDELYQELSLHFDSKNSSLIVEP